MKRAMVALIAGTVLSGLAAAYASTTQRIVDADETFATTDTSPQRTLPGRN
jgi:hypothetical protein